jgi:hypothetical protein
VPSTTLVKIAAGVVGSTGTCSLGISAFAVFRLTTAQAVPSGMWAALVMLVAAAALVSSLGLILEYRLKELSIEEQG